MEINNKYLSNDEICAIYKCLDGHIHVKYRTLDITMEPEEFLQVAHVFSKALSSLERKKDVINEEIGITDIDTMQKV